MVTNTPNSTNSSTVRFKDCLAKLSRAQWSKPLTFGLVLSICVFSACTQNPGSTTSGSQEQTTQTSNELVAVGSGSRPDNMPIVVPSDSLIVPGVGVGDIKLDVDAAPVMKKLGKPDAGDAAMGKAVATWFEQHDATEYALTIFTAKDMGNSPVPITKQIRVTAPTYKTKHGIGISSTLTDIQKAFAVKEVAGYRLQQETVTVYADSSGIAFEINKNLRCIGIVIYPKGDLHRDTYARLVPGSSSLN